MVAPTEPRTKEFGGCDLDQSDWACSDDDFDPRPVGVVIHNLSERGTVWEASEASDGGSNQYGADTSEFINPSGFFQFLDSYDHLLKYTELEEEEDDALSHQRKCYINTLDRNNHYEENGWCSPDRSPHDHFDFNYEVPYETSHEVWDCVLNHNNVLVKENRCLQQQLQEQNVVQES